MFPSSFRMRLSGAVLLMLLLLGGGLRWHSQRASGEDEVPAASDPPAAAPRSDVQSPMPAGASTAAASSDAERVERDAVPTLGPSSEQSLREQPFEHPFLSLRERMEVAVKPAQGGRWERRLLGRVTEYPDAVLIKETFAPGPDGWRRTHQEVQVAEEFIVKLAPGETAAADVVEREFGGQVVRGIRGLGLWTLRLPVASLADRATAENRLSEVFPSWEVGPNPLIWPSRAPDDPGYGNQWELRGIDPEPGWDLVTDARINDRVPVVVAVVDTGVNTASTDLRAWRNRDEIPGNGLDDDGNGFVDDVHGYDFFEGNADVQRETGHGVGVAAIAGSIGNNGEGRAAPAWNVEIMAGVCFSREGAGSTSAAVQAIYYAVVEGARVINCSFVGGYSSTYAYVFKVADDHEVVIVAGAGNNGRNLDSSPLYPVCSALPNVVGVGSSDGEGRRASYSNYSASHVEVFAPHLGGTSFATPLVSSLVALMIGEDPEAPDTEIIARLTASVDRTEGLAGLATSGGRVNLTQAIRWHPLRRPEGLQAWALEGGGVRLFWRDRATVESGYVVERTAKDPATVADPDDPTQLAWSVIADQLPPERTWYEDLHTAGGPYFYRVRARGLDRPSGRNPETRVAAAAGPAPPRADLAGAVATIYRRGGADAIELAWLPVEGNATGFVLERRAEEDPGFYELGRLDADTVGYLDDTVVPGASYRYRLKTFNASEGAYSGEISATATEPIDEPVLAPPTAPTFPTVGSEAIVLEWTQEASGALGVRIWRSPASEGPWTLLDTLPADAFRFEDRTMTPGATSFYAIEAFNAFDEARGPVATVEVPPAFVLASPPLAATVRAPDGVSLGWSDDQSAGHEGYRVERAEGQGAFARIATVTPGVFAWFDATVVPETLYRYRVSSFREEQEMTSDPVTVETWTREAAWRLDLFGTLEPSGPAAPEADPDGDGWPNRAEFATGHSPVEPQPFLARPTMTSEGGIVLIFRRLLNPPVDYRVEATDALSDGWQPVAELRAGMEEWDILLPGASVREAEAGALQEVEVEDAPRLSRTPRYLRLVVGNDGGAP